MLPAVNPTPWIGTAYRHIAAGTHRSVLDFRFSGRQTNNRWNDQGQPTLYLAGDPGILIAEWGRHFPTIFDADLMEATVQRSVYRLSVHLDAVIDVRAPEIGAELGFRRWPHAAADQDIARFVASRVRNETSAQAILVPSVAFLDDLTRWNLVVFLDKTPSNLSDWIHRVDHVGPLRWR